MQFPKLLNAGACGFDPKRRCADYSRGELVDMAHQCGFQHTQTLSNKGLCKVLADVYFSTQTQNTVLRNFYRNVSLLPGAKGGFLRDLFAKLQLQLDSPVQMNRTVTQMFPLPYSFTFLHDNFAYRTEVELTVPRLAHVLGDMTAMGHIQEVLAYVQDNVLFHLLQMEPSYSLCQLLIRLYVVWVIYAPAQASVIAQDPAFQQMVESNCDAYNVSVKALTRYATRTRDQAQRYWDQLPAVVETGYVPEKLPRAPLGAYRS